MKMTFRLPAETWAAWRTDDEARAQSSSGGMATAISEAWIDKGGVVYGTAFVRPFDFRHIRCTTHEELKRLRGSKYVQSSMSGVLSSIDKDVKSGLDVLFIGTPCQVGAVIARFGDVVYTIDVICHGVPNIEMLKASLPANVFVLDFDNIEFRDSTNYRLAFRRNGDVVWSLPLNKNLYMKGFFKAVFNRSCCYTCRYAQQKRVSDMSLGDFWGLNIASVDTTMDKGISLVLVNTGKGHELLALARNEMNMVKRSLPEAVAGNQPLQHPCLKTWRNTIFQYLYPKVGFRLAAIAAMPDIVIKNLFK